MWSFGNDFARNVVICGVDNNSWSSHIDNCKYNVFVSGEGPTDDNDGSVFFSLKKQRQNFARVCIMLVIVVIYLLTEKNIYLKVMLKM